MSTKQTNLTISATGPDNKKVSNTISYVNPNLSNATALEFAKKINALTKNSYQSTEKVDRIDLDTAILNRRDPTIRIASKNLENNLARIGLSELTWNASRSMFQVNVTISTGVDANQIPAVNPDFINITSSDPNINFICSTFTWYKGNNVNAWYMTVGYAASSSDDKQPVTFTFQIQIPAGDGYDIYLSPVITMEIYDDSI